MSLDTLSVALVVAMVPFATASTLMYGFLFPWRAHLEGRVQMLVLTSFTLLVVFATVFHFVPEFPGKDLIRVAVYSLILGGFIGLTWVFGRQIWAHRRAQR